MMIVNSARFAATSNTLLQTVTTGVSGANDFASTKTVRHVLASNFFAQAFARIEIDLLGGTSGSATILKVYIGQAAASGDAYDFAGAPTEIKFASASGVVLAAAGTATSDRTVVSLDATRPIVISMDFGPTTTPLATSNSGSSSFYFSAATNEAATVDVTGYTLAGGSKFNGISALRIYS